MKTINVVVFLAITLIVTSCASTDAVKKNAWGFNNNPERPTEFETVPSQDNVVRSNQRMQQVDNDQWQNPMVVNSFNNPYYSSIVFNAQPRFIPVMVPWWESSMYWNYNSRRHSMFQCDPMLVYWDWYSPYYNTNPFWGGNFVPTRYAWGGFTHWNPPISRTIVEPVRTQQVRDFGPSRGTTSGPPSTRQTAPVNDGWNSRSQNYRPSTPTTNTNAAPARTKTDGWNSRTKSSSQETIKKDKPSTTTNKSNSTTKATTPQRSTESKSPASTNKSNSTTKATTPQRSTESKSPASTNKRTGR